MKTASPEIRQIAVRAQASGLSLRQIAQLVGYHPNTVSRWLREYAQESRLQARPRGHRTAIFSKSELQELDDLLRSDVRMTLAEIRECMGKQCSLNAIHKHLKALRAAAGKRPTRSAPAPKAEDGQTATPDSHSAASTSAPCQEDKA